MNEKIKAMDENPINVTVIHGSTAILPCAVQPEYTEQYRDRYKVNVPIQYDIQSYTFIKSNLCINNVR